MDLELAAIASLLLYTGLRAFAADGHEGASVFLVKAEAICPGLADAAEDFADRLAQISSK